MTEWIEVPKARLRLREDGIVEVRHDDHVQYTGELAAAHVETCRTLLEGRRAPLLIVVGRGFKLEEAAREFLLRSDPVRDSFTCGAMLLGNRAEALATNLFLKVSRPVCPMKAFAREQDALAWMREH